jgi:hypothetical protein
MNVASTERKVTFADQMVLEYPYESVGDGDVLKSLKKVRRKSVCTLRTKSRVRSGALCPSVAPSLKAFSLVQPSVTTEGFKSARESWEAWKEVVFLQSRSCIAGAV